MAGKNTAKVGKYVPMKFLDGCKAWGNPTRKDPQSWHCTKCGQIHG